MERNCAENERRQREGFCVSFRYEADVKIPKQGKRDKHAPQELSSKIRVRRHKVVDVSREVRGWVHSWLFIV